MPPPTRWLEPRMVYWPGPSSPCVACGKRRDTHGKKGECPPLRNGITFEEGMPLSQNPEGTVREWEPYKLWSGDQWQCPGCGTEILAGMRREPLAEHYKPDYPTQVKRHHPIFRVDDC